MNDTMRDVDRMSTYCMSEELCQLSWITQPFAEFRYQVELHLGIFYFSNKNPKGGLTYSEGHVSVPCYTLALFKVRSFFGGYIVIYSCFCFIFSIISSVLKVAASLLLSWWVWWSLGSCYWPTVVPFIGKDL